MPPSFSQACTVLGIREDSTRAEARSAYLRLAKTYHPDRAGGASDKFNDVVEAFACFAAKRGPEEHHGRGNVDRSFESASTVWEECGEKEDVDKEEEFRTAEVFTSVLGDVFARMAKGGTCVGTAGKPVRPKNGVAFEIPTGISCGLGVVVLAKIEVILERVLRRQKKVRRGIHHFCLKRVAQLESLQLILGWGLRCQRRTRRGIRQRFSKIATLEKNIWEWICAAKKN
ncbi:hypothetical protein BC829DRAFT_262330 [Chytridium lagenaria]|nr:hypothetical protein BC829DRAFT_262330 [Chytridium lagenaria]